MNEIIQIKEAQEYELMKLQAGALFKSGMFPDLKSHAQAVVKVMVGKELGMSPFQSVTCIYMVNGKPEISARGVASLIAKHPLYSYRIIKATKEICEIEFYDKSDTNGNENNKVGMVSFSITEAQEAGLLGKDNWKKYPSDMLFARALSRGCRRYAPGIFNGAPVYVEGELDPDRAISKEGVIEAPIVSAQRPVEFPTYEQKYTEKAPDLVVNTIGAASDEAIIEEIKKTHIIDEEFR